MVTVNITKVEETRGMLDIWATVDGLAVKTRLKAATYNTKEKIAQSLAKNIGAARPDLTGQVKV